MGDGKLSEKGTKPFYRTMLYKSQHPISLCPGPQILEELHVVEPHVPKNKLNSAANPEPKAPKPNVVLVELPASACLPPSPNRAVPLVGGAV